MAVQTDPHLSLVRPVTPRTPEGCEECLILGPRGFICSVWLLFYGVMEITLAFRIRSTGKQAARVAHAQ